MSRQNVMYTSFDGGEVSPLFAGRMDQSKYATSVREMRNFFGVSLGPAVRRPGTRLAAPTKVEVARSWLFRFQVSQTVSYMVEVGHLYMRFYVNRGQLLSGMAAYEIATPYAWYAITAVDGTCTLRIEQVNDVAYLFSEFYQPHKLQRTTPTTFSITPVEFTNGPFQDVNTDKTRTVYASDDTGSVTLTANTSTFYSDMIGTLFYMEQVDFQDVLPWETQQQVAVGDIRRVGRRVYECTAVGVPNVDGDPEVTGTVTPTHVEGKAWDGDGKNKGTDSNIGAVGAEWLFLHAGYGIAKITGVASGTSATASVVSRLPAWVVGSGGATYKWAAALFDARQGWPTHGTLYRERLALFRGRAYAMSVVNDYENFASRDGDVITADSSIRGELPAAQLNRVQWVASLEQIVVGTVGDEWLIGPANENQAFGPENRRAWRRTKVGSKAVQPAEVNGELLFVQLAGRSIRNYEERYEANGFISTDVTALARHITNGTRTEVVNDGSVGLTITSAGIVDLAYQPEPHTIVWALRGDGVLLSCVYDRQLNRSDVFGWAKHPMTNGVVECIETMPSPDGTRFDLWMIVRREIDGEVRRYVEWLDHETIDDADAQEDAHYVDCGAVYSGAPATTISGLDYLEGQEVAVLVDGAAHPRRTVTGGEIELQEAASVVHVGLPYLSRLVLLEPPVGSSTGTAQGKLKRVVKLVLRLQRTLAGRVGDKTRALLPISYRKSSDLMDVAPPLFSGDIEVPWNGQASTSSYITVEADDAMPFNLLAVIPEVDA